MDNGSISQEQADWLMRQREGEGVVEPKRGEEAEPRVLLENMRRVLDRIEETLSGESELEADANDSPPSSSSDSSSSSDNDHSSDSDFNPEVDRLFRRRRRVVGRRGRGVGEQRVRLSSGSSTDSDVVIIESPPTPPSPRSEPATPPRSPLATEEGQNETQFGQEIIATEVEVLPRPEKICK